MYLQHQLFGWIFVRNVTTMKSMNPTAPPFDKQGKGTAWSEAIDQYRTNKRCVSTG